MKLSEWIDDLKGWLDDRGDVELLEADFLADAIPDDVATRLLESRWVECTLLPDGVIVPGVLDSDPENGHERRLGWSLEDKASEVRETWGADERAELAASLRRALAVLEA